MRIVFMGTPEFALPSLKALLESRHEVVGVFTQPDRPVGRGHKLDSPPVKKLAEQYTVPVFQFEKVRRQAGLDAMRALNPDLVVTAAFDQILSQKLLDVPRLGTVNVHASLLPRHRGAAPINWSIMQGDKVTGVTTMLTDAGLDTGDMLLKAETDIDPEETAGELTERLSEIGAELLIKTIDAYENGEITPEKQDESRMTYDPMLEKGMGEIDWRKGAQEVHNLVRGVNPWPGAYTSLNGETLKIWKTRVLADFEGDVAGSVLKASAKEGLVIACGAGAVEVLELQMPGGKRMQAKAYLSGKNIAVGTVLGETDE